MICNPKSFPSDFFETNKKDNYLSNNSDKNIKDNNVKDNLIKSTKENPIIILDLQKEYDEDKEIIDLLEGKAIENNTARQKKINRFNLNNIINKEKEENNEKKLNKKFQITIKKKNLIPEKEKNEIKKLITKNKINKNISDRNIETPSTSEITHDSNKRLFNLNNTIELSKDKTNILSAKNSNIIFQNANNNIIIPMIPLKRPSSNFNIGEIELNNRKNIINRNNNDNNLFENNQKIKERIKIYSAPHPNVNNDKKLDNIIINKDGRNKNFGNIIYNDKYNKRNFSIGKIPNKLHRIKIEKGMINSKLIDWNYKNISIRNNNLNYENSRFKNIFNNNSNISKFFTFKKSSF